MYNGIEVICLNKPVRKAVRTFIFDKNKVIAIRYSTNDEIKDYYDIPGGKIEDGETNEEASIRECKEETGIEIISQKLIGNLIIEYPNRIFDFDIFIAESYKGCPKSFKENNSMWINIYELLSQNKIFPTIEFLKPKYKNYFKFGNFKIKFIVDDNHNILNIEVIKNDNGYVNMWNNWSKKRSSLPVYDNWLDDYLDLLNQNKDSEILDLGCGIGADTLYLIEKGFDVLSCDFSIEALKSVEQNIPNSKTKYLDMLEKFPFNDNSYSIIIADLSLHYFDNETTIYIMKEIKRILKSNGILLARVASINDFNFGAGVGTELERNFYFEGDYTKRFFDEEDINNYFKIIGNVEFFETSMIRNEEEYSKPKVLYQVKVMKGN